MYKTIKGNQKHMTLDDRKNYLIVQTARGSVYRVILSDSKRKYREGNIVRFYTTPESLCHLKDGEYEVNVVFAMERISAKITSDEDDEKILAADEKYQDE